MARQRGVGPSLEVGLYALLTVLAALLRLWGLGEHPLEAGEAGRAYSAWMLAQGQAPATWDDPLVISGTALAFFLFGANDFTARLVPALAGLGLIPLCWWLRGCLGRGAALAVATVFCLSPSLCFFSRHLSGETTAAFLGLVAAVGLARLSERPQQARWLLAVVLGLLLASGSTAFSIALALALFGALAGGLATRGRWNWESLRPWAAAGALTLVVFAVASTAGFSHPQGLGIAGLGTWLEQFNSRPSDLPWFYPAWLLVGYEPLILICGLAGAIVWLRRLRLGPGPGLRAFFALWSGVGVIVCLLAPNRSAEMVLLLVVPLSTMAGDWVAGLLRGASWSAVVGSWELWGLAWLVVVFVGLVLSWLTMPGTNAPTYYWALPALGGLGLVLLAALALWRGQGAALALAVVLPLLLGLGLHNVILLNHVPSPAEGFVPTSASSKAATLAARLKGLYSDRGRLEAVMLEPLEQPLAWYLRDMAGVRRADDAAGASIVLATTEAVVPNGYRGRQASLGAWWVPPWWHPAGLWRWLLYRDIYGPVSRAEFVVYIRR